MKKKKKKKKKKLSLLQFGREDRSFIYEIAKKWSSSTEGTVPFKAVIIMPSFLLQKPSKNSLTKDRKEIYCFFT